MEDLIMVETATKLPIKTDNKKAPVAPTTWHPFEDLRHEVDRLFEDFGRGNWMSPFRSINFESMLPHQSWNTPAVDIVEKDRLYEITAELPGLDAKNLEVTLRNGNVILKGEKQEEKEEKSKDYYVKERQYGSFERSFALPDGVDASKVEATFKNGILSVTLPKTAEAQKPEKKVEIKAA
jgi:HSP20 family protein